MKTEKILWVLSSLNGLGIWLMRIAIFVIFFWIGGLKFFHYEANGIVPFVANSPFMSFFYNKPAPEYKAYKIPEGAADIEKTKWHESNGTYTFSRGLGVFIMTIGTLVLMGGFFPKLGILGASLAAMMTVGTLSFLVTTPECWVQPLGDPNNGFPYLTGAGRLVIKDCAIFAGAILLLADSARRILKSDV